MGFLDRFRQAPGSTGLPLHFAAVDVETTGLDPVEDRIVELAVVLFDARGTVLDEWTTLVNPRDGDAGVVAIHGIQGEWLAAAPTFREIAETWLTERSAESWSRTMPGSIWISSGPSSVGSVCP